MAVVIVIADVLSMWIRWRRCSKFLPIFKNAGEFYQEWGKPAQELNQGTDKGFMRPAKGVF